MNNEMNTQETKAKKGKKFTLHTIVDFVVKALPIITIVFLALGIISFFYEGFCGIINCFIYDGFANKFGALFRGLEYGIVDVAKYLFYAVISAFFSKVLNRK